MPAVTREWFDPDEQRILSFGRAIDAIAREVEANLGEKDALHIERIGLISRIAEGVGRTLLHFSFEPIGFGVGVATLWLHKSLELMEIGHMALHGAYDRFPTVPRYHAALFRWKAPIDEASWRVAHNVRHHQYTNVEGRDPDLNFGVLRLSARVPHRRAHALQPVSNLTSWFGFATAINLHVTGMLDIYFGGDKPEQLRDKNPETVRAARRTFFSKLARYYGREYVLFPALAGPFFWKVLLGNVLSEVGRDIYSAAVIYCGHVGAKDFPASSRAKGRARWYIMQVEAARNIEVPHLVSILCGGLDRQIEHHLFPRLPPNRLREIAPRVRAVCEAHGVRYLSKGWFGTLRDVARELRTLSSPSAAPLDAVA
jgi:NADPH-dependent stearoyl-CoA 9-desaturase